MTTEQLAAYGALIATIGGLIYQFVSGRSERRIKRQEQQLAARAAEATTDLSRDEFTNSALVALVNTLRDDVKNTRERAAEDIKAMRSELDGERERNRAASIRQADRITALENEVRLLRESERHALTTVDRMRQAFRRWFTEIQTWNREGRGGPMPVPPDHDMHLFDYRAEPAPPIPEGTEPS